MKYQQLRTVQATFKAFTFEAQKYHWLVTGKDFFNLHAVFEDVYNWSFATEDKLAEKLLAYGECPVISYDELIGLSKVQSINELPKERTKTVLTRYVTNLNTLKNEVHKLIDEADEHRHDVSDLATELLDKINTLIWQIKAYQQ